MSYLDWLNAIRYVVNKILEISSTILETLMYNYVFKTLIYILLFIFIFYIVSFLIKTIKNIFSMKKIASKNKQKNNSYIE